jgi:hypothetical protein
MTRRKVRPKGKVLTPTECQRRWRANVKRKLQAQRDAERVTRRIEVTSDLGILKYAIADLTEADLASGTVAAVITDPPYDDAAMPLYDELAGFAMRVLKPGGWCLVMTGDLCLAAVLGLMTARGLVDRGYVAISFNGGHHFRLNATATFQAIKLVLLLQKPPFAAPPLWGPNLLTAPVAGHDKSLHHCTGSRASRCSRSSSSASLHRAIWSQTPSRGQAPRCGRRWRSGGPPGAAISRLDAVPSSRSRGLGPGRRLAGTSYNYSGQPAGWARGASLEAS